MFLFHCPDVAKCALCIGYAYGYHQRFQIMCSYLGLCFKLLATLFASQARIDVLSFMAT